MSDSAFYDQVNKMAGPTGLVFFIKEVDSTLIPREKRISQQIAGMQAVMDYEPSKAFRGTDEELYAEAERRVDAQMAEPLPVIEICKAAVFRDTLEEDKKQIEAIEGFVKWTE